jgi:hypothetical protein
MKNNKPTILFGIVTASLALALALLLAQEAHAQIEIPGRDLGGLPGTNTSTATEAATVTAIVQQIVDTAKADCESKISIPPIVPEIQPLATYHNNRDIWINMLMTP